MGWVEFLDEHFWGMWWLVLILGWGLCMAWASR
jgi:hypothetical protein